MVKALTLIVIELCEAQGCTGLCDAKMEKGGLKDDGEEVDA